MWIKLAIKLRIKPPKRRTALQRLKARLYYRRNRTKIKVQRKRYLREHGSVLKNRKLFKRYKPTWFKKPSKPKHTKPKKFKVIDPNKVKIVKPKKKIKPKKFHIHKPKKFKIKVPKFK
jgi:hypothetical protein